MKILILGGYGTFGGRVAELLLDRPGLTILIAGRDLSKAKRFCARHNGQATLLPVALDRSKIDATLGIDRPDLVVDASGPFQTYGAKRYTVVEACIAHGVDYLDLADGADFVDGIAEFDAAARAKGVYVISGVSSFPVLTAAVLEDISKRMTIRKVEAGIAPSPHARVGLNVLRAVLSYAGMPVSLKREGNDATGLGLVEVRRKTVCVSGHLPLPNTRFSLVDVPDLRMLPKKFPDIEEIWMGAGPRPEILHWALNKLAWVRARLRLPQLTPLAGICFWVLNRFRFGEHRGGMYVVAKGIRGKHEAEETWCLLAEEDDGPLIPSMAIEGLVRKLLNGQRPEPGARSEI
ncbi:MAG: saccharopine dehydrogenase NADP-binding domain-containing protein, partial [Pseudomonadota bacterium]